MSNTYILETSYSVNYTTKEPAPIAEIIESLQSLERIIKRTPAFLEKHYQGIEITETKVLISSIESGSLKEKFFIRFVFKTRENYDAATGVVEKILEDNEAVRIIVAAGIGAIIGFGASIALPSNSPKTHIEAYNNNIINIGGTANFSAEDVVAILDGMGNKKAIAKDAVSAIKPAKADNNATIEMGGITALTIDSKFVAEAPKEYEAPLPKERATKYSNVDLLIFASDRDNYDKGWAGSVPQLFSTRVKLTLTDAVDPSKVHGKVRVKADILVHERFQKSKKKYVVNSVEVLLVN